LPIFISGRRQKFCRLEQGVNYCSRRLVVLRLHYL